MNCGMEAPRVSSITKRSQRRRHFHHALAGSLHTCSQAQATLVRCGAHFSTTRHNSGNQETRSRELTTQSAHWWYNRNLQGAMSYRGSIVNTEFLFNHSFYLSELKTVPRNVYSRIQNREWPSSWFCDTAGTDTCFEVFFPDLMDAGLFFT